ncbi:MAG: 30S ribosomal protein S11, partial [Chloroflexi bacterium]|nr:30S ribosomal protein S11 [Chloroflexota bacterium]
MAEGKSRSRRREKKSVPRGRAYIQSTFNNTLVTLTDPNGNVIASGSAGSAGFKGSRKSTAFAAQRVGETAAKKAMEHGLRQVEVYVRGPGAGREPAIRALQSSGLTVT